MDKIDLGVSNSALSLARALDRLTPGQDYTVQVRKGSPWFASIWGEDGKLVQRVLPKRERIHETSNTNRNLNP